MEHKQVCTEEGCDREQFTAKSGLCQRHYDRARTARLAADREDPTPVKQTPCDECGAQGYGRFPAGTGPVYCKSHWDKLHRRGTTAPAPPKAPAPPQGHCVTPGHEHKVEHGRTGLCQACYRAEHRRELDPAVGTRKPGPKPGVAREVKPSSEMTARGRVLAAPQKDDHRRMTVEEKTARRAARKAAKTHCVHGHELTPGNTYLTRAGQKVCRLCQRRDQQRHAGRTVTPEDVPIGPRNKDKTHCPWGHAYAEYGFKKTGGHRGCKACYRESRLAYKYKLKRGEYAKWFEKQEGKCAICRLELKEGKNLHVDHDWQDGSVRGLLCGSCNNGLGRFKDDPARLRASADYIEQHRGRM